MSSRAAARSASAAPATSPTPGRWRRAPEREAPPRPSLRVVSSEAPARGEGDAPPSIVGRVGVTLLVLLFASVFALVVFQAVLAQSQRRLDDLRTDLTLEEEQAKALRLQLAQANAPDRIAVAAQTRLGLVPPDAIVYLEPQPGDDGAAAYDPATEPTTTTTTAPPTAPGTGQSTTATTSWSAPPTTSWSAPPTTSWSSTPTTSWSAPPTTVWSSTSGAGAGAGAGGGR